MSKTIVSEKKAQTVHSTAELLKKYSVIGVADLHKIRTPLLQDLKRQLRDTVVVRCVKNTLLRKTMEQLGLPFADRFFARIAGSNVFIFSNMNPFKLSLLLQRNKVRVTAKPGDVMSSEVIVPAGNTGIAPGPILSRFGNIGLKTRIDSGTIWVNQDAVVANPGDKLSEDAATVLSRLGIKAGEMGLLLKSVYDEGLIIEGGELVVDLKAVQDEIGAARTSAVQVAVGASYPIPETIAYLLSRAREHALRVAVESGYPTTDTASLILAKAQAMAAALEKKIAESQRS